MAHDDRARIAPAVDAAHDLAPRSLDHERHARKQNSNDYSRNKVHCAHCDDDNDDRRVLEGPHAAHCVPKRLFEEFITQKIHQSANDANRDVPDDCGAGDHDGCGSQRKEDAAEARVGACADEEH